MRAVTGDATGDTALSRAEYRQLVGHAETYRKALVVRLIGEVGLRTAEITRLRPDDVRSAPDRPAESLLDVRSSDGETTRVAYVPSDLERDLDRYVRSNGVADGERVIDVSPRRVQMLVADVADRAADRTADDGLGDVSASDLRAFFARTLLVEERVDPQVVKSVGGWQSLESFDRFLDAPDETEIVDALANTDVSRSAAESGSRSDAEAAIPRAAGLEDEFVRSLLADSAARALVRLDAEGYVERWLDGTPGPGGYERRDLTGRHLSSFYAADDDDLPRQHLETAAESGGCEARGWRLDGDDQRFWARTVLTAHRERGRLRGFTAMLWDLTDRKRREEDLRERAESLVRRRDVRERVRSADDALLGASDRDELEAEICERLAAGDEYAFAWIATSDLTADRCTTTTRAGVDRSALDALIEQFDDAESTPPWIGAMREDVVRAAEVDDDPTGADVDSVTAVPLSHRETTYGTLVVASGRSAPDDWERTALADLGRRIGHAVTAIQRRNLLLSDAVVELEFWCRDDGAFFVDASDGLDCTFSLESIVPVSSSSLLFYVTVEDAAPGDVFDRAVDHRGVEEVRLVETHDDGALMEFVVGGDSPLLTLTAYGATITDAVIESGEARLLGEVARDADLRAVVDGVRTAFPNTELVGKHEVERPVRTVREFREGVEDELTDRQEATLRAAFYAGYFDWPRGSTAEEIADSMEVSSPTLHNHLRKGQRALLETFFEGPVGGE